MRLTLIILITFILPACRQHIVNVKNSRAIPETININIESAKCLKFSELFENPQFIQLETNPYSLFGTILQTVVTDSNIIIVPKDPQFCVIIFNSGGKFLRTINNTGRGPNEYIALYYISLEEKKSTFSFFDPGNRKLVTMDLSGKLLSQILIKQMLAYNCIVRQEEGDIVADVYSGGVYESGSVRSQYHLSIYKPLERTYLNFLPVLITEPFMTPNGFYKYRDSLYYAPPYLDTIYRISSNSIIPRYFLDFGSFSKPEGIFRINDKIIFKEIRKKNICVWRHFDFKETDHFIYSLHYVTNGEWLFHYYDKKLMKSCVFNMVHNDYIGQNMPSPMAYPEFPVGVYNDCLIFIHEPTLILNLIGRQKEILSKEEYDSFMKDNELLMKLAGKLKPGDNPILGFYKMKVHQKSSAR